MLRDVTHLLTPYGVNEIYGYPLNFFEQCHYSKCDYVVTSGNIVSPIIGTGIPIRMKDAYRKNAGWFNRI